MKQHYKVGIQNTELFIIVFQKIPILEYYTGEFGSVCWTYSVVQFNSIVVDGLMNDQ